MHTIWTTPRKGKEIESGPIIVCEGAELSILNSFTLIPPFNLCVIICVYMNGGIVNEMDAEDIFGLPRP